MFSQLVLEILEQVLKLAFHFICGGFLWFSLLPSTGLWTFVLKCLCKYNFSIEKLRT